MDIVLGYVKQHSDGSSPVATQVSNSFYDYRVKYIGLRRQMYLVIISQKDSMQGRQLFGSSYAITYWSVKIGTFLIQINQ